LTVIDDIVPGHTGKGADFRLAEMKHGAYPGIYHMIEIEPEDWAILPDVPHGRDSVNIDAATEEQLDTLDVDGWHALWGRIWAANRVPFVRRLQQLLMAGEMEPMALRASLQPTSTPAASIPETEGSASSTPSPSPTDTPPANSRPARRRRS